MREYLVLIFLLLAVIVIQQVYFMAQIQRLVDKLMSRSYTEYVKATAPPAAPKIKLDLDPDEDLGSLNEFMS